MSETSTEEQLARALLTLTEVESCVAKVERYLETNGKYLDLDARVPMERQTEAMRNALNAWKTDPAAADDAGRASGVYRPCAGCDSVSDSCRAVGCPAARSTL